MTPLQISILYFNECKNDFISFYCKGNRPKIVDFFCICNAVGVGCNRNFGRDFKTERKLFTLVGMLKKASQVRNVEGIQTRLMQS